MSILQEIFAYKREEVAHQQQRVPVATVRERADQSAVPPDFVAALRASSAKPALIAEVKRASPSRGQLAAAADPLQMAEIYQGNGAAAVSVLTDVRYFQGHLDHLALIAGHNPDLPLLRKDFVLDPYQIYQARAAGAAAVLLIASALRRTVLHRLHDLCGQLEMAALVEVHTAADLEAALTCNPTLIGINNRDLSDFSVDLDTTRDLLPAIPPEVCIVSESGISSRADVIRLAELGVEAMLVGEALVTAADRAEKVRELVAAAERQSDELAAGH